MFNYSYILYLVIFLIMTDKLSKKDQLIMYILLEKLTIDIKITIENALTDDLLSLREEITSLKEEYVISNNKVNFIETNIIAANIISYECGLDIT